MAGHLNHQTCVLDRDRAAATTLRALSLNGLMIFVIVRAKKLSQIGMDRAGPGNRKHLSSRRNIFLYGDTGGSLNFMQRVGIAAASAQGALHLHVVRMNRGDVASQRS